MKAGVLRTMITLGDLFLDMLLLMAEVGIFAWSERKVSIQLKEKIATTVQRNI